MTSYSRIFDVLLLIALSLAIPITFLARPLVTLLYGESYIAAAPILTIHIWAGLFAFMRQLFSRWLILEGLLKYSFFSHAFGAVVNVILNLLLIPRFGGTGSAVATLCSYATSSYLALFLTRDTRGSP